MKQLFYLLVSIVLLLGLQLSCTQEELPGGIYGTVVDKATGEPIRSAGVELSPSGMKTVTGSEGQFEFAELAPGNYTLIITKAGYSDFASSIIEVKSAQTTKTDVQIEKLPPSLRVVDDKKGDIEELDFGSSVDDVARSFNLFNDGTESLEWQITTTAEWIKSVSKTEGVLKAGETQSLIVIIDRILLKSGKNTTTVHITSNNGSKQLEIIATGPILTTLNTLAATNVKTTTATLNGEILTDGSPKYSERGFVYSESSMPTLGSCIQKITSTLTDSKTYSATVAGLTKGKTYYVRAYAINAGKEAYSTNEVSFTPSDALPQVSTRAVTNISRTAGKATFNGTIIDEGEPIYTERGFVYAITHNPMVDSDTKVVASGKGRGEFVANATELVFGNTYYVRAYATNTQGTAYGEEVVADFKAIPPQVTTVSVEYKSNTSAYLIGKITNAGDPEYTERGFIYGTMQTPMIDDDAVTKLVVAKNTSAQFEKQITNANWGNHLWYVRAYAIGDGGVSYGEIKTIQEPEYAEYLKLPTFDFAGYLYHVYPDMGAMTWSQAMSACNGLSYGGYDDWYLPNIEELNAMYQKKSSIGGFSYYYYWSSTEYNSSDAYYQEFYSGDWGYDTKNYILRVRCVRREN